MRRAVIAAAMAQLRLALHAFARGLRARRLISLSTAAADILFGSAMPRPEWAVTVADSIP